MTDASPETGDGRPVWLYGLTGGIVAMPLLLGHAWLRGDETIPLTAACFGGLVAGYLATRDSASATRAGTVAGCVGALPGVLLFLPALYDTVTVWIAADAFVLALIVTPLVVAFAFGLAGFLGFLGGLVGRWLAGRIGATDIDSAAL